MTPRRTLLARDLALLGAGFLLVLGLCVLRRDLGGENAYPLLFLPLILWAGYLRGLWGALSAAVLSAAAVVTGHGLSWMSGAAASALVVADVLALGTAVLLVGRYDEGRRTRTSSLLPAEARLLQVERKARAIREQIEDYEERLRTLTKLYESAKKVVGILDLDAVLEEARALVARTFPGHFRPQVESETRLGFYVYTEPGRGFERHASRDTGISDEGLPTRLELTDLQRWSGDAFSPVRVRDQARDPRFQGTTAFAGFHSLLIVPLVMQETLSGVMVIATEPPEAFSALEFHQASVLGKQIVFALRKALLYREVQQLSITDNLTGLYVHRYFQERFVEELARAERYRHPLSLILIDLDNFKRVNDTQGGHLTGDAVLAEVAARIRENAGAAALVARYGGEEFAVLLPNLVKARALNVAQTIRAAVKSTPIDVGGDRLTVTLSAGVCSYPEDALAREELIRSADAALYQAKHNGRDLVVACDAIHKEKNS